MNYNQLKESLLNNPSISNSLKQTLISFDERDSVDALKDARMLVELFHRKCRNLEELNSRELELQGR